MQSYVVLRLYQSVVTGIQNVGERGMNQLSYESLQYFQKTGSCQNDISAGHGGNNEKRIRATP